MRFGIFTTLYDCGGGAGSPAEVLDNLREQVALAEQLGYDAVWMGEHHFGPYGLGDLPNPIVVGADLAARTSRIRIGQMANIAVWWHPLRLAEDLAILDNLTRGRVDVGFGRGVWPYESCPRSSTTIPSAAARCSRIRARSSSPARSSTGSFSSPGTSSSGRRST
jgi:alkanesulfonate monooxygenase SsuD/methylene tetrahydromethanopterin reductase-like flavin-dependent oxidoreductase (luciferase family)